MRIVVASPPKSGNHWAKCLLGTVYGLSEVTGDAKADLPDGSVMHTHARFTRRLCEDLEAIPAHVVTIVRDPYDAFVSLYYWAQERGERDLRKERGRPRHALIDKPLDHPDVLAYLADEFGSHVRQANGWLNGGRSLVLRYEGLHADPVAELTRVTGAIAPVAPERVAAAIAACTAENMRLRSKKMQWHVRSATVGDSRQRLGETHLAIFRERHGDAIRSLGYEVR